MSETEQLLAERYGRGQASRTRNRIAIVVGSIVLVVAFLSWAISVSFFGNRTISFSTDSFSVINANQSSVSFTVTSAPNSKLICAIRALNSDFQVVGFRHVALKRNTLAQQSLKTTLNTTERPVSVEIQNCQFR